MRGDDIINITIYVKFRIGDVVYHKMEMTRKSPGIITGYVSRPTGTLYYVSWGAGEESPHYDMELTKHFDKDFEIENAEDD